MVGVRYAGLLALAVCGCTMKWRLTTLPPDLSPTTEVEIWSHGASVHWRSVWNGADSVRGIPSWQSISCTSCRQALARADVDSFRLHKISEAERAAWGIGGALAFCYVFYLEIVCGEHGGPDCPFGTYELSLIHI